MITNAQDIFNLLQRSPGYLLGEVNTNVPLLFQPYALEKYSTWSILVRFSYAPLKAVHYSAGSVKGAHLGRKNLDVLVSGVGKLRNSLGMPFRLTSKKLCHMQTSCTGRTWPDPSVLPKMTNNHFQNSLRLTLMGASPQCRAWF